MTGPAPAEQSAGPAPVRRYGPGVGEPPLWVDPRRWGSLIGLAGGLLFIASYSSTLGAVVSTVAWTAGVALVLAAVSAHYVWPVALGPLAPPRRFAPATYLASVAGELALIAGGSRALTAAGVGELRPALIAAAVGLHLIPFAWAFHDPVLGWLGALVCGLGATGLVAGASGLVHAAEASAVLSGLGMLIVITVRARGLFAPPSSGGRSAMPRRSGHHEHLA